MRAGLWVCSALRTTFAEQITGKFLDPGEGRLITDHAAVLGLDDETGSGEEAEVMGERRGGDVQTLLNIADAQAFGAGADEGEEHLEARLGADRGEGLGRFDVVEVTGIVGGFEGAGGGDIEVCATHISIILEL